MFGLFMSVFGSGGAINAIFIMVESRMPSKILGSSMVIVVTTAVFYSSLSPFIAYMSQPVPFLFGCSIIVTAIFLTLILPKSR